MLSLLNNPSILVLSVLTALNLVFLVVFYRQFRIYRKRQKELFAGEEVQDLEELVLKHKKTLTMHNKNLKELGKILEELVDNNKLNIQKVGIVRYNPFADAGGNMSFSMALLDGHNNGIVISSLHSREATRIYAKPIESGKSKYPLTDEEKEAIAKAGEGMKQIANSSIDKQ